jgi:hypothetical protein
MLRTYTGELAALCYALILENSPLIIIYDASSNITVFTGKELHAAPRFIGTDGSFTAVKRLGREADHSF